MQQLLRIGPRESKPYIFPPSRWSGRLSGCFGHQSPLWRTFGFPDLSVSRRNGYPPAGTPAGCQFWHIPMRRQKRGQVSTSRREKSNPGFPWSGSVSYRQCDLVSPRPKHPLWSLMATPSELSNSVPKCLLPINFARYHEELLPTHVEFAFKSKDSWARQNTVFWQISFLNKGLKRSLSIWTGKPCPCAGKMSKENY